ncbi:signal peptidase I [Parasphingorhabdus pacifica]
MADVMRSGPEEEPQDGADEGRGPGAEEASGRRSRRRSRKNKKGSFWRELPILIVTALVLTVLIQAFLARVYVIPSQSMETTLHGCSGCNNDRVLVDKVTYRFTDPAPGDVVVFRGPHSWGENEFTVPEPTNPVVKVVQGATSLLGFGAPGEKDFVKRVIATGGQTVECCDPENRVLVDGEPLTEPYIHWDSDSPAGQQQAEFEPVTVPQGHLWVMGDNRNNSADSRVQGGGGINGAVPVDNVIGKTQVIVLPPTRWGAVSEDNPQNVALSAPSWQAGVPMGVGVAGAFPVVWIGRRLAGATQDRNSREQR